MFCQSSFNMFDRSTYQGYVKIWNNSIFHNWDFCYFYLLDNCLIKIPLQRQIKYSSFNLFKNVTIIKLDHFTIMKSNKKNNKIANVFGIKLLTEKVDLLIATASTRQL